MSAKFAERLAARLAGQLPGRAAQARFEPDLAFGRHAGPASASARAAAVMLLIYPRDDAWFIPLTVRPAHLAKHGGQISLPGGLVEPGETTAEAALREVEEELGVERASIQLFGELSPLYLYVTDYQITPHVGWTPARPNFRPSTDEVAELIELPLAILTDESARTTMLRTVRGLRFTAPAHRFGEHEIWGATSMILSELADVLVDVRQDSA